MTEPIKANLEEITNKENQILRLNGEIELIKSQALNEIEKRDNDLLKKDKEIYDLKW